jgi:hypothetical protein
MKTGVARQGQTMSQMERLWGVLVAQKKRGDEEEWQERKRKKKNVMGPVVGQALE